MKTSTFVLMLVVLFGGAVSFLGYQMFRPDYVRTKCTDCEGTGKASCGAAGCVRGVIPCPNADCLQLTKGNWMHMHVDGHSDSDIWFKFDNPGGGWSGYNQAHVGHVIQVVDGKWTDVGTCPVCQGATKIECPACHGQKVCPTCQGKGYIEKKV